MALRNDYDINKQKVTSTPISSTPVSSATTTSTKVSTPIPIGQTVEKKDDPITKYINSKEFLAKTQEEQIADLQKQFPNIDKEQLSVTLISVKSTIENKDNDDTSTLTSEPKEMSEGEKALYECQEKLKQKSKKDVSIDDVIFDIKKTKEYKRTPEQIKALEYYEGIQNEIKNVKIQQLVEIVTKYGEVWDNAIDENVLNSDEWKSLSPQEKMAIRVDNVLTQSVEGYASKSEREKTILRENFYSEIGKLTVRPPETWESLTEEKKERSLSMIAIAADAAGASGMKIGDLVSSFRENPEQFKDMLADYAVGKIVETFDKEKLTSPEWIKLSANDQLSLLVDSIAKKIYPNYELLELESKQEIKDSILDNIGRARYKDWDSLPEAKTTRLNELMVELSALCSSDKQMTYSEFKHLSEEEQIAVIRDYEHKVGITPPEAEEIRRCIRIKNNSSEVTDTQVKEYINKIPLHKRSKAEKRELNRINLLERDYGQDLSRKRSSYHESLDFEIDFKHNGDIKAVLQEKLKPGETLENLSEARKREIFKEYAPICFDLNGVSRLATALGIPRAFMISILNGNPEYIIDAHSDATVKGDGISAANVEDISMNIKSPGVNLHKTLADIYNKHNSKDENALTMHAVEGMKLMGAPYAELSAQSINEYGDPSIKDKVHANVACAQGIPDSSLAIYSQTAIQTASSDNDRYRFMQSMSKSGNPAVLEGLAAASNSVKDPGIRSKYDSYVDNAIANYPPETQSRIRQARETGEISSYTLSQTTVSGETSSNSRAESKGSTVDRDSEGRTEASQTPQAAVKTSAEAPASGKVVTPPIVNQNKSAGVAAQSVNNDSVVSDSAKTSATNTPQQVSATSEVKVSNTVAVMNDKELVALTKKAEAVLEKIETFMAAQAESIEQRKLSKASETTAESIAATMSEEDIIEAIASSDIDPAKLDKLNLSEEEKETLRKTIAVIFENNSVSAAYKKFVNKFGEGAKLKFLEVFAAKGDSISIRSFANDHKNDSKIISILYQYSQDSSLIAYLPKDEVFDLLLRGKISDLTKINPDILADFIQERMKTEKNPANLLGYLKLLPLEYQGAVLNQYPDLAEEVHGSDKWLEKNAKRNAKTNPTENPEPQVLTVKKPEEHKAKTAFVLDENLLTLDEDFPSFDDGLAMGSTTVPNPRGKNDRYDKRKIKGHIYIKG